MQGNGNLLIVKGCAAVLELHPGDEFEINLERKQIRLIGLGEMNEEDA